MNRERRKFGDQRACAHCGQDIEWHGREHGWRDRGNGRECLPHEWRGPNGLEIVTPRAGLKHTLRAMTNRQRTRCGSIPGAESLEGKVNSNLEAVSNAILAMRRGGRNA